MEAECTSLSSPAEPAAGFGAFWPKATAVSSDFGSVAHGSLAEAWEKALANRKLAPPQ